MKSSIKVMENKNSNEREIKNKGSISITFKAKIKRTVCFKKLLNFINKQDAESEKKSQKRIS